MTAYEGKMKLANIKRSKTAILNQMEKQYNLNNLSPAGVKMYEALHYKHGIAAKEKAEREFTAFVARTYDFPEMAKNRSEKFMQEMGYLSTGKMAKEYTDKYGRQRVNYGRAINELYKRAKAADVTTLEYETIKGRDKDNNPISTINRIYFDTEDITTFVSSLQGTASIIALRIQLGEDRDEVLDDYGY